MANTDDERNTIQNEKATSSRNDSLYLIENIQRRGEYYISQIQNIKKSGTFTFATGMALLILAVAIRIIGIDCILAECTSKQHDDLLFISLIVVSLILIASGLLINAIFVLSIQKIDSTTDQVIEKIVASDNNEN